MNERAPKVTIYRVKLPCFEMKLIWGAAHVALVPIPYPSVTGMGLESYSLVNGSKWQGISSSLPYHKVGVLITLILG